MMCEACAQEMHPKAQEGIALFNRREYFEAHEALETAWRAEPGPIRDLYQGILQVAVAYYHLLRGNYRGASKMFHRCRPWLAQFPETCQGVDLVRFRHDVDRVEQMLVRLGPEHIDQFDPSLLMPLPMIISHR